MVRYKRYLYTGGQIPASTIRSRNFRKRKAEANALREKNDQNNVCIAGQRAIQIDETTTPAVDCTERVCDVGLHDSDQSTGQMYMESIGADTLQNSEQNQSQHFVNQVSGDLVQPQDTYQGECHTVFNEDVPNLYDCLPPLCSHTECTADDIMLMTLSLGFRHKLTWVAMVDILKMFNTIYGEKKIKASKVSFKKRLFDSKDLHVTYHYFCNNCCVYIEKSDSSKKKVVCSFCDSDVTEVKNADYFVSLSLESQLKKLLSNENIAEMMMNYRFTRIKENENNLEDIYDGSEYKKHSGPGKILSYPENFSYSFFTDGVPLGKTKKSLWPIYVSINELSPNERRHHILLVGLHYGAHDPNQQVFLTPFVHEANKLASEGFSWTYKSKLIKSKVVPLVSIADSVARCQLLNFQTFTAFYGCTFCYQKTKHTKKKLKYVLPSGPIQERSAQSTRLDLIKVYERRHERTEKDRVFKGVKGPSTLSKLLYFALICGFVVDNLHNILLGVTRTFFELVFDTTRRKAWNLLQSDVYAMSDILSEIDKRLLVIKPPTAVSRAPRSIHDFMNWKANEWRSWLLFYCIPCLIDLMKNKYLVLIAMLSKATSLLLSTSVSLSDVQVAHQLFQKFAFYYQKYFGEEYMYYNIHLLSHVGKGVLRFGPLFTHNAFMYEGFNKQLLNLCKNPFRVIQEVSQKYLAMNALPNLINTFCLTDETIFFCEDILDRKLVRFKSCGSCFLLGAGKACGLLGTEREFLQSNNLCLAKCLFYDRMLMKNMRVTTAEYASKFKKNDDSFVFSSDDTFYQIRAIILVSAKDVRLMAQVIPVSENFTFTCEELQISHISKIGELSELVIVTPNIIKGQCIVDKKKGMFITKIPVSYSYGD